MNDFQGLLSGDYGFKPQGKSAPMAPPRSNPSTSNSPFDFDLSSSSTTAKKPPYSKPSVFLDDQDDFFSRPSNSASSRKNNDFGNLGGLDDVFGASSKSQTNSSVNLDSGWNGPTDSDSRFSSLPVFDKPVYDDDVFDGVPGLKTSSSAKYEDVFSSPSLKKHDAFDDLLGGFTRKEPESKGLGGSGRKNENDVPAFDDLLPGFGASTAPSDRDPAESSWDKRSTVNGATKSTSGLENPFVGVNSNSSDAPPSQGFYSDPLEQFTELGGSSRKNTERVSASGNYFGDIDPLVGLGKSVPMNEREKVGSPARTGTPLSSEQTSANLEATDRSSSVRSPGSGSEKKMTAEDYYESPGFASEDFHRSAPNTSSSPFVSASDESASKRHTSTAYDSNVNSSDDIWLTVSEVPLFTQPTVAPPPSRPPPPRPPRTSKAGGAYEKKKIDNHPSFPNSAEFFQSPKSAPAGGTSTFTSPIDELEDFAKGRSWNDSDGNSDALSGDDLERHSDAAASAAAMKEAMDRAEARFKHAKEVRERENAKVTRMQQEREDKTTPDFQERDFRELQERQQRERHRREEEERKQREEEERKQREEEERKQREEEERLRREREEREREQRRIERERIERERARQAVERATREARERAAVDARARAEKAAVGKVQAEARERAERAAVMKAQAEARERAARAAFEAKQRSDREKVEREAREKAEREAKEKEEREKAAAASARAYQQRNQNDLDAFFGMGSRANSAPRARASSSDPFSDSQIPKKQAESVRTSVGSTPNIRKTSSSANIVDDLSAIFGGPPSAGQFQEVDGETEERRRARLDRHQRTQERAAKALAEKNKRDLDAQKEQAERHRIAETLDVEIKRWAAGKEGNLRALLSTMQYVLWPECGWQPVSLTDLITGAAVKKVYRKATLCIHPDKVQQKGANLQQKYIAEKVFDLLKEAWNKFNSEELF